MLVLNSIGLSLDRDYRITREDLLKYGDHALSHMIVDRIFDAAPRPFAPNPVNRNFMSFEDFIYFMFSEEDKANEVSIRYWVSHFIGSDSHPTCSHTATTTSSRALTWMGTESSITWRCDRFMLYSYIACNALVTKSFPLRICCVK